MKKIVTLILLSCITLVSVAQIVVDPKGTKVAMDSSKWKISGNNIYNKNTGNVGIGTSNPAYKLDVSAAANPVRMMGVQNGNSTDSVLTIINGVIKKVAASSFNRNDSTTANNGLNLTGKNIQLGGSLTQSTTIATAGNALNITGLTAGASTDSLLSINTTTGRINRINPSSLITATTNSLSLSGNTLTSTVNGIAANSNAVSNVSNTSATNTLTTSVNGVAASGVNIINSNSLGLSNGALTSTVNGVASSPVNVLTAANNGLTAANGTVQLGGTLTGATTIATSGNALNITGLTSGASTDSLVTVNTATGKISRINPLQFINNDSTTASNGLNIISKDVQLGGNLTKATTITNNSNALTIATGGSAMNITGLTSGASTDSIVTINQATGKLNMINRTSILAGSYINNSSTQQASSNFNISGNGTVGGNLNITGIPVGSMLYMNANGRISGVTSNLFYDTVGKSVGIGTNAPARALDVVQNNATSGLMKLQNTNANGYSSIDIWDNVGTQIGNIGYANNGSAYSSSFYFATNTTKNMVLATNNTERIRILGTNGNVGIGVATPTASLHLDAGTSAASTAPLKFTSGTLLSTPEAGAVEFDGNHYYGTISGTRYQLDNSGAASTTNTLALSGNTLTSTVNGITASSNAVSGVSNTSSANTLTTTVNGVTGTAVSMVNSIFNSSSGNNLSTTVNGITGTAVPMINTVSNNLSGSNLTTTVNGVTGAAINLSGLVPTTTHSLAISGNTLTSIVNGISASSNAVSGVSNTSSANTLTTTVNGVTGSTANIINTNALGLSNGTLTSTVNGVASSTVNVLGAANNGVTANNGTVQLGGSLTGATTIATGGNAFNITGLTPGTASDEIVTINTSTGKLNKISQAIIQDSTTASNGITLNGLDVKLGGALTSATTIGTSSTNTLNITGLQTGTTSDSLVTILNGKINKISQAVIQDSTTASNGLTLNGLDIKLGGALSAATTITTTGTNTLAVTGLQSGASTDSIVVVNPSTGVLKRISPASLISSGGNNTTASNGLTVSSNDVQLGGTLSSATTLTTSSTNTLTVLGVQTGTSADSLLVLGSNSEIKKVVQMPTTQYAIVNSDLSLTSSNSAQSALPSDRNTFTANGSTIYEVEGSYIMTTGTTNNKSTAISFGGTATANYVALNAIGWNAATGTTTATQGSTAVITLSNTVITASANLAGVHISFKGIISVNAGGTLIPQITFSNAPGGTNTMKAGSYIKFTPLLGSVNGSFN